MAVVLAALVACLASAGPAAATTFCVPGFHAACPNSGGNVAEADLEKAMGLNGSDGKADAIVIAAGTIAEDGSFEPAGGSAGSLEPTGTDPLTVTGAGRGQTIVTSTGAGNEYLLNLNSNNSRAITVRDLTLRVPASFTPDAGTSSTKTTSSKGSTSRRAPKALTERPSTVAAPSSTAGSTEPREDRSISASVPTQPVPER